MKRGWVKTSVPKASINVKDGAYAWSVQVRWTHGKYPEQFSGTLTVGSLMNPASAQRCWAIVKKGK